MAHDEYNFVKVSLKEDVAKQIDTICNDLQKECEVFVSKSDLLRIMVNDKNVIEYVVKKIVYDINIKKSGDLGVFREPTL